jgi:hypothetical protein
MSDIQILAGHKVAAWLARGAARVWPEETRHWGLAIEAELSDINSPSASVFWALGGVMLLTRAWWNHLLHSWMRPAGVPEGSPLEQLTKNASRVPRTPRFVTAILLLVSSAALLIPDVRDGMRASFDAWHVSSAEAFDDSTAVAPLRKQVNLNHDPQAMALLALLSNDKTERIRLANDAVQRDPSLTWIYSEVRTTDGVKSSWRNPLPAEWLDKLQKWDPDNAVPRLLVAQQSLIQFEDGWQRSGYRGLYNLESKKFLEADPKWLAAMDFAFRAPKYDAYGSKRFDLYRTVVQRYGFRDSRMALYGFGDSPVGLGILMQSPFFRLTSVITYDDVLLDRGDAAERAGNLREAERLYREPAQFSDIMAQQSHTDFERGIWVRLEGISLRRLIPLLAKTGHAEEVSQLSYKLEGLQTSVSPPGPVREWAWSENGWEGFAIRMLTAAILLFGAASLVSLGALFLRRRAELQSRGAGLALASLVVDYCPILLVISCAGLFVAYRPIALMYHQYMGWPFPIYDFRPLYHALYTPYESPEGVSSIFYEYFNAPHYWMVLIVGLTLLAVYILFRRTLRGRAAVS